MAAVTCSAAGSDDFFSARNGSDTTLSVRTKCPVRCMPGVATGMNTCGSASSFCVGGAITTVGRPVDGGATVSFRLDNHTSASVSPLATRRDRPLCSGSNFGVPLA